jgi:hypothetical protein
LPRRRFIRSPPKRGLSPRRCYRFFLSNRLRSVLIAGGALLRLGATAAMVAMESGLMLACDDGAC